MMSKNLLHIGCNVGSESMPKAFDKQCNYTELYLDDRLAINLENIVEVPNIIFLQIQSDTINRKNTCQYIGDAIRKLKDRGAFIINWTGDKRQGVPSWMLDFAKNVSSTGFSNEEDVNTFNRFFPESTEWRAVFLQQGIDTDIFNPDGEKVETPDIVFLANNYGN